MALTVPAHVERSQRIPVSRERAFELLLDVPAWAALFPRVDTIEAVPAEPAAAVALDGHDLGAFHWAMVPMGPPGLEMTTEYACRYAANRETWELVWIPVEGVGNARFSGAATLVEAGPDACDIALRIDAELSIPAPRLLRRVVETAVHFEFGRTVDTFLDNVSDALEAGV